MSSTQINIKIEDYDPVAPVIRAAAALVTSIFCVNARLLSFTVAYIIKTRLTIKHARHPVMGLQSLSETGQMSL